VSDCRRVSNGKLAWFRLDTHQSTCALPISESLLIFPLLKRLIVLRGQEIIRSYC